MNDIKKSYICSKKVIKQEAKEIVKISRNVKYSEILDILVSSIGYQSFIDFKKQLKYQSYRSIYLENERIDILKRIEDNLVDILKKKEVEVKNISFLSKIIEHKKKAIVINPVSYEISDYLFYLPFTIGEEKWIIVNDQKDFNDHNIKIHLQRLYKKYEINYIFKDTNETLSYDLNMSAFDLYDILLKTNDKSYKYENLLNKNYREFYFSIKDYFNNSNSLEGAVFLKLKDIKNGKSSIEDLVLDLKEKYLSRVKILSKLRNSYSDLNFINLKYFSKNEHIRKISKDNKLLLGNKKNPKRLFNFLNKIENIEIEEKEINNTLILGSAGCGRTDLLLNLVYQSILKGNGCIYITHEWDVGATNIMNLAKEIGERDRVILISGDQIEDLEKLDINEIVKENKILIILNGNNEKSLKVAGIEDCFKLIEKLESKILTGFNIYFDDYYYKSEVNNELDMLEKINEFGIKVFMTCNSISIQRFKGLDTESYLQRIKNIYSNIIFMKIEDLENIDFFIDLDKKKITLRDLKSQNVGDFHFIKNGEIKRGKAIMANLL